MGDSEINYKTLCEEIKSENEHLKTRIKQLECANEEKLTELRARSTKINKLKSEIEYFKELTMAIATKTS